MIDRKARLYYHTEGWWHAAIRYYNEMVGPTRVTSEMIAHIFDKGSGDFHEALTWIDHYEIDEELTTLVEFWYQRMPTMNLLFGEHV